ncbi:MAG: tetratricopeptide repeat protein [Planctomycetes bacterium]|nr:tetratricopeptide repeat protein [Planctomycetota bacterium]
MRISSPLRIAVVALAGGSLLLGAVSGAAAGDEDGRRGHAAFGNRSTGSRRGGPSSSPGLQPRSTTSLPTPFSGPSGRSARRNDTPSPRGQAIGHSRAPGLLGTTPRGPRSTGSTWTPPSFGTNAPSARSVGVRRSDRGALPFTSSGSSVPAGVPVFRSGTRRSSGGDTSPYGTITTLPGSGLVAAPSSRRVTGARTTRGNVAYPSSGGSLPFVSGGSTATPSRRIVGGTATPSFGASRVVVGGSNRVIGTRRIGTPGLATPPGSSAVGLRGSAGVTAVPYARTGSRVALPSNRVSSLGTGQVVRGGISLGGHRAYPSARIYGATGPRAWRLGYNVGRRGSAWRSGHGWYLVIGASASYTWDWCLEPVFGYGTVWVSDPTPYIAEPVYVGGEPVYEGEGYYTPEGVWVPAGPQAYPAPQDDGTGGYYLPEGTPYEETWDEGTPGLSAPQGVEQPTAPASQEEELFAKGVEAFLDGRHAEAELTFHLLSLEQPENGQVWMALLHARFAQGNFEAATTALNKAAAIGAFPRGYRFDPTPLYRDGSFPERMQALERHLGTYPRHTDALLLLGYFQVALGQEEAARASLDRVLLQRRADPTAILLQEALLPAEKPAAAPGVPVGGN